VQPRWLDVGRLAPNGVLATLVFSTIAGCDNSPRSYHESFVAMHSYVELTVVEAAPHDFATVFQLVRAEVQRLESVLSDFDPESNVGRINRRVTSELAPETRMLLERAQQICHETEGAFDVSMGPLKRLWGFGDDNTPAIPPAPAIEQRLLHVGCDVYRITEEGRLLWNDEQARIDLGGIAQGLVAQRTAEILVENGFMNFLINVSGDIVVRGTRPDGQPWRIGVQNPRYTDSLIARISMRWPATTTSGDYEQYFIDKGRRLHHIFDPKTGWPATGAASVSVFCEDAIEADCYATALFVLGAKKGLQFLEKKAGFEGLFTYEDHEGKLVVLRTSGLQANDDLPH